MTFDLTEAIRSEFLLSIVISIGFASGSLVTFDRHVSVCMLSRDASDFRLFWGLLVSFLDTFDGAEFASFEKSMAWYFSHICRYRVDCKHERKSSAVYSQSIID